MPTPDEYGQIALNILTGKDVNDEQRKLLPFLPTLFTASAKDFDVITPTDDAKTDKFRLAQASISALKDQFENAVTNQAQTPRMWLIPLIQSEKTFWNAVFGPHDETAQLTCLKFETNYGTADASKTSGICKKMFRHESVSFGSLDLISNVEDLKTAFANGGGKCSLEHITRLAAVLMVDVLSDKTGISLLANLPHAVRAGSHLQLVDVSLFAQKEEAKLGWTFTTFKESPQLYWESNDLLAVLGAIRPVVTDASWKGRFAAMLDVCMGIHAISGGASIVSIVGWEAFIRNAIKAVQNIADGTEITTSFIETPAQALLLFALMYSAGFGMTSLNEFESPSGVLEIILTSVLPTDSSNWGAIPKLFGGPVTLSVRKSAFAQCAAVLAENLPITPFTMNNKTAVTCVQALKRIYSQYEPRFVCKQVEVKGATPEALTFVQYPLIGDHISPVADEVLVNVEKSRRDYLRSKMTGDKKQDIAFSVTDCKQTFCVSSVKGAEFFPICVNQGGEIVPVSNDVSTIAKWIRDNYNDLAITISGASSKVRGQGKPKPGADPKPGAGPKPAADPKAGAGPGPGVAPPAAIALGGGAAPLAAPVAAVAPPHDFAAIQAVYEAAANARASQLVGQIDAGVVIPAADINAIRRPTPLGTEFRHPATANNFGFRQPLPMIYRVAELDPRTQYPAYPGDIFYILGLPNIRNYPTRGSNNPANIGAPTRFHAIPSGIIQIAQAKAYASQELDQGAEMTVVLLGVAPFLNRTELTIPPFSLVYTSPNPGDSSTDDYFGHKRQLGAFRIAKYHYPADAGAIVGSAMHEDNKRRIIFNGGLIRGLTLKTVRCMDRFTSGDVFVM